MVKSVFANNGNSGSRFRQLRTQDFEKEGARNFRKFEKNKDLNRKFFHLKSPKKPKIR